MFWDLTLFLGEAFEIMRNNTVRSPTVGRLNRSRALSFSFFPPETCIEADFLEKLKRKQSRSEVTRVLQGALGVTDQGDLTVYIEQK